MVVERVEPGGGEDAGLPHGAAEALLPLPRGLDEGGGTGQNGTHRAAEPLAEIHPDRIERGGEAGGVNARFHDGVEEPGAVHMEQQPVRLRRLAHRLDGLERPDRAAALVRGLLHHREPRARRIAVHGADRIGELLGRIDPGLAVESADHGAGERRRAAAFGGDDVGGAVADHLVAGAAMDQQRDLVAHGAGREEDGGLLAQQGRDARLKRVDRGVFAALLVADLGLGHGVAHGRRRPRHRVAPEIDVIARHATLSSIVNWRPSPSNDATEPAPPTAPLE